jgi:protocatechuate 3,4-dioxygenase beta subunit
MFDYGKEIQIMDNDDKPVGRILTRREVLSLLGGAGTVAIVGSGFITKLGVFQASAQAATPEATDSILLNCVASPQQTEGPYFVDEMLNRSDIRSDPTDNSVQEGIPLALELKIYKVDGSTCSPLTGAHVDIWHCNATGLYSDESNNNTVGQKWLRGYQVTDEYGAVKFLTIYPGWYQGRTVHIHMKVRTYDADNNVTYEYTSQLFFDDTLSDQIFASAVPYTQHTGRDTTNATDGIFNGASTDGSMDSGSGEKMLLTLTNDGNGGYTSTFSIGIDTTLTVTDNMAGGGPGGAPPGGGRPGTRPGQPAATATPSA